jgi:hypothetical protein
MECGYIDDPYRFGEKTSFQSSGKKNLDDRLEVFGIHHAVQRKSLNSPRSAPEFYSKWTGSKD